VGDVGNRVHTGGGCLPCFSSRILGVSGFGWGAGGGVAGGLGGTTRAPGGRGPVRHKRNRGGNPPQTKSDSLCGLGTGLGGPPEGDRGLIPQVSGPGPTPPHDVLFVLVVARGNLVFTTLGSVVQRGCQKRHHQPRGIGGPFTTIAGQTRKGGEVRGIKNGAKGRHAFAISCFLSLPPPPVFLVLSPPVCVVWKWGRERSRGPLFGS